MLDASSARRGLFLVFLILFLDIIGIAIIVPVLPTYLERTHRRHVSEAAVDGGWLMLVYSGMQFLFAPLIGNLVRPFRPPADPACLGADLCLDNLICALADQLLDAVRRPGACRHQRRQLLRPPSAYIADISDDENRAKNFGLIGIAFGIGFALGPVLGGLLGELRAARAFLWRRRRCPSSISWSRCFSAAGDAGQATIAAASNGNAPIRSARSKQMRNYPGIGWVGACLLPVLAWRMRSIRPSGPSSPPIATAGARGRSACRSASSASCGALVMAFVLPQVDPAAWRVADGGRRADLHRRSASSAMRSPGRAG